VSDQDLRDLERRAETGDLTALAALERARARAGLQGFAVISDVHGNLEALTAVFQDIDHLGIRDVICLGDLVGDGPDPVACTDLVMSRCRVTVRGCREAQLDEPLQNLNPTARVAWEWVLGQLRPRLLASPPTRKRWEFIETLPLGHREGADLFAHGAPGDPNEFLFVPGGSDTATIERVFEQIERLLFIGHTHHPEVITADLNSQKPSEMPESRWTYNGSGKAIINVGSVGQPRDRDPRACYVTVRGDVIEWRRITYDFAPTMAKMREISALNNSVLIRRLEVGL
jgi:hypothetical protein